MKKDGLSAHAGMIYLLACISGFSPKVGYCIRQQGKREKDFARTSKYMYETS